MGRKKGSPMVSGKFFVTKTWPDMMSERIFGTKTLSVTMTDGFFAAKFLSVMLSDEFFGAKKLSYMVSESFSTPKNFSCTVLFGLHVPRIQCVAVKAQKQHPGKGTIPQACASNPASSLYADALTTCPRKG